GAGQRGGATRAPPLRARRLPAGGGPGAPDGAGDGGVRDPGRGPERGKDPPRMERPMSFDAGAPGLPGQAYGLPHTVDEARVVLVPVPFEATTSYGGGAAEGPAAVLRASAQVDLFDLETGRPYVDGIAMLPEEPRVRAWNAEAKRLAAPIIEAGGAPPGDASLARVNAICEELNAWLERTVARLVADGKLVATVGGDHGSIYGESPRTRTRTPAWASSIWMPTRTSA